MTKDTPCLIYLNGLLLFYWHVQKMNRVMTTFCYEFNMMVHSSKQFQKYIQKPLRYVYACVFVCMMSWHNSFHIARPCEGHQTGGFPLQGVNNSASYVFFNVSLKLFCENTFRIIGPLWGRKINRSLEDSQHKRPVMGEHQICHVKIAKGIKPGQNELELSVFPGSFWPHELLAKMLSATQSIYSMRQKSNCLAKDMMTLTWLRIRCVRFNLYLSKTQIW